MQKYIITSSLLLILLMTYIVCDNKPSITADDDVFKNKNSFERVFTLIDSIELTNVNVLSNLDDICFDSYDNIFVLDKRAISIHKFDPFGKLIKSFSFYGEGPNELPSADAFSMINNNLYVLSNRKKIVKIYDLYYNEIKYFKINNTSLKMLTNKGSIYLLNTTNELMLDELDNEGNYLNSYMKYPEELKKNKILAVGGSVCKYQDNIGYIHPLNDNIYILKNKEIFLIPYKSNYFNDINDIENVNRFPEKVKPNIKMEFVNDNIIIVQKNIRYGNIENMNTNIDIINKFGKILSNFETPYILIAKNKKNEYLFINYKQFYKNKYIIYKYKIKNGL
jgi:hypothetical protein